MSTRNRTKVLVIDDNQDLLSTLEELLETYDFKVLTALSAKKAENILQTVKPDIIICDIMMPGKDGIQFTDELRKADHTADIPVIFLTAKFGDSVKLSSYEAGGNYFLNKPYNTTELVTLINTAVNHQKRVQSAVLSEPEEPMGSDRNLDFFKTMNRLIEENLSNPDFHYSEIAQEVHLSPSALQKKVQRLTGKPISRYIREYRLKVARKMLEKNMYSISEAAIKTGFNSLSYFSRSFTNYFKVTPRRIKRLGNTGNNL